MKKILVFFCISGYVILSGTLTQGQDQSNTAQGDSSSNNSELAVLMRKMQAHLELMKNNLPSKKIINDFPMEFVTIYSAPSSKVITEKTSFDRFADDFIFTLNNYRASDSTNIEANYEKVVKTCIACHQKFHPE